MSQTPSALLLITTECPHCPSVLKSITELVKEGQLSSLEIVNISVSPERAEALSVRSVPWIKLGEFVLTGLKSKAELQQWINSSGNDDNNDMSAYFEELMTSGELSKVQQMVKENPQHMQALFNMMANDDSSLSARIGVGAIIEQLSGTEQLINSIDALGQYCKHKTARVRNDACYYLGLSQHLDARKYIRPLLNDEDPEIIETAKEALEEIND
ncbi:hypothetical protein MNBD_GAMMA09-2457 [hydrothermal vent metagenome]|uniref:Thioredoxin-like fold domain-containing protein n=1 Tax=hydrothermal vent metagenome TaxID=652676 RepID=A0A3B0Y1C3_9ZZZZ